MIAQHGKVVLIVCSKGRLHTYIVVVEFCRKTEEAGYFHISPFMQLLSDFDRNGLPVMFFNLDESAKFVFGEKGPRRYFSSSAYLPKLSGLCLSGVKKRECYFFPAGTSIEIRPCGQNSPRIQKNKTSSFSIICGSRDVGFVCYTFTPVGRVRVDWFDQFKEDVFVSSVTSQKRRSADEITRYVSRFRNEFDLVCRGTKSRGRIVRPGFTVPKSLKLQAILLAIFADKEVAREFWNENCQNFKNYGNQELSFWLEGDFSLRAIKALFSFDEGSEFESFQSVSVCERDGKWRLSFGGEELVLISKRAGIWDRILTFFEKRLTRKS